MRKEEDMIVFPANTKCKIKPTVFGPYTHIFENSKTSVMYDTAFKTNGLIDKLNKNNNVIIFGFGFSGSGKTYQLISPGNKENLVSLILKDENLKIEKLDLEIIEMYPYLFDKEKEDNELYLKSENGEFEGLKIPKIDNDNGDKTNFWKKFYEFNKDLEVKRMNKPRILPTTNNPESSRSHLFYKFNLTGKENKNLGSLIIVDMAGTENTIEIKKDYMGLEKKCPLG